MCFQYVRLRNRLRARVADPAHASRYLTMERYGVCCLRAAPVVEAALAPELCGRGPVSRGLCRVYTLVWRFVQPLEAAALGGMFWLPPSALCFVGHTFKFAKSRRGRMHRHAAFRGGIGSLAVCCGRTAYGKVVEVVDVETSVCASAVASAIDQDPTLHAPLVEGDPNHCWHACRLTHRFRFLHAVETPCETWGSYLHNIHAAQNNFAASRYGVRLFLKEAQLECVGHSRDEAIVHEIASYLVEDLGRNPFNKRQRKTPNNRNRIEQCRKKEKYDWCVSVVRRNAFAWEDHAGTAFDELVCAGNLDPGIAKAVLRRTRKDISGHAYRDAHGNKIFEALRMIPEDKRTARKSLAASVVRENLQKWLNSESGATWRAQRESLFDDADDFGEAFD